MRDPKRILEKILGNGQHLDQFEHTGEPLEQLVNFLRDVVKCRRTRQWIADNYGIDMAVSPETFSLLLDIPQINFIENSNRLLEVESISLRETRNPGDPVTVGNLNSVLREFYRNLESIQGRLLNDYPDPFLTGEMRGKWVDSVMEQVSGLKKLHGKLTGYLFNLGKVKTIERDFAERFPASIKAHPLRRTWPTVERELEFYRKCNDMNERWKAIDFDLFQVIREDGLSNLRENVQEMGNLLWKLVYNRKPVERCLDRIGIEFTDTRSVFDADRIELSNI